MPATDVAYPAEAPTESAKEVIRIVRGRTVKQECRLFAMHAWALQGFLQGMVVGSSAAVTGLEYEANDEQMCQDLEYLVDKHQTGHVVPLGAVLRWLMKKITEEALRA